MNVKLMIACIMHLHSVTQLAQILYNHLLHQGGQNTDIGPVYKHVITYLFIYMIFIFDMFISNFGKGNRLDRYSKLCFKEWFKVCFVVLGCL